MLNSIWLNRRAAWPGSAQDAAPEQSEARKKRKKKGRVKVLNATQILS